MRKAQRRAEVSAEEARERQRALEREAAERRQAEAAVREQRETLEIIHRVGQALAAELELEKLVQEVTDAATERQRSPSHYRSRSERRATSSGRLNGLRMYGLPFDSRKSRVPGLTISPVVKMILAATFGSHAFTRR